MKLNPSTQSICCYVDTYIECAKSVAKDWGAQTGGDAIPRFKRKQFSM